MAFKKLSQNEIAVLSNREREAYERAYKEYLERTAFVDKLEKLEKVKMPSVAIKRKGIKKIKSPTVPVIKAHKYKVDTTAGVNLLNVTKKVNRILGVSSQPHIIQEYKASLPEVLITAPDEVNITNDVPFIVEKVSSVPVAVPSQTQYNTPKVSVAIPQLQEFIKPEIGSMTIDDYSIRDLPSVNTDSPNIPNSDFNAISDISLPSVKTEVPYVESILVKQTEPIKLQSVTIAKPAEIKDEITEFKISRLEAKKLNAPSIYYTEKNIPPVNLSATIAKPADVIVEITDYAISQPIVDIAMAPVIDYTWKNNSHIDLSPVLIPEHHEIFNNIKSTKIQIPAASSIKAPEIGVEIITAEIEQPKEVYKPVFAPEIHITKTDIKIKDAPVIPTPKRVHYSAPNCQVKTVQVPTIAAPRIDADTELQKILSKIR